jgi:site-specific recombinase XerC
MASHSQPDSQSRVEGLGQIAKSPTTGVETPKRERNTRRFLRSDEYTKMLSLAGANPRDYAILRVFLQTRIRVSELASLTTQDVDFLKPSLPLPAKGRWRGRLPLRKKVSKRSKTIFRCGRRVFQNGSF